jgi:hypothetical protein
VIEATHWTPAALGAPPSGELLGYACPMHAETRTREPGICAECGMDTERCYGVESP